MALGTEVIDFVRLHLLDHPDQIGGIGQVPVMQDQPAVRNMGILIEVIDTVGIEQREARRLMPCTS